MASKKTTSKKTSSKAATKTQNKEVVETSNAIDLEAAAADAGAGMEGADSDSYAIPFLRILQKLSPQVDEDHGSYIEGAKAGMFFNSVSGETYKEVTFLPCAYERKFLRWEQRHNGGKYRGQFYPEQLRSLIDSGQAVEYEGRVYYHEEAGKVDPGDSDVLMDTRGHYGLIIEIDGEPVSPICCLLSLSSTQIKISKRLMSLLSNAKITSKGKKSTPPTWMNRILLSTVVESNDQGSWSSLVVEPDGFIEDNDLYIAGREFNAVVKAGEAKTNYEAEAEEAAPGDNGTAF